MVSSWKSFLSLYCSCGPLHEDDVELRNVRHISGPLVSIPTYRARAYNLNHLYQNLPRTASVPAIIMTDPTEEVIE